MSSNRRFFVGGNWKMNGNRSFITNLVSSLNQKTYKDVDVLVAPPSIYIDFTSNLLKKEILLSAQNCHFETSGAFTGEISAEQIKDSGLEWVILGHSERRHIFKEDDNTLTKKIQHAQKVGLNVIACIGETLEQREKGQTIQINSEQLKAFSLGITDWNKVVIAYEPVWAIGTGKNATPEMAQEVHKELRNWLAVNVSQKVAESTRIIYGGSVKPNNARQLSEQPDIDGFLVGGASLEAKDFISIIESSNLSKL
eukprot:TRINITY_DN2127_c0_g1_i1.p1 TRINITY_DN2127_c0_g1~~TRINITY_DN2127_c0_g1_i1.p1  ORF type:complete len:254 (-),score=80.38 TRINITY_DN2127_c0_g1_i1:46-807(-)